MTIPDEESKTARTDPLAWVDSHGDYLYKFAFSRLHDQTAAEDAVQETFLAALKAKDRFAGASTERTWLTGILKHKIVDHFRKVIRERPTDQEEKLPCEREQAFVPSTEWKGHWMPGFWPSTWGSNPESFLEKKEFWEVLQRCVKVLPARMAAVYTLYEMEEQATEDICKEYDLTSTNLWVILHRSRKQLRRCLELNWMGQNPRPKKDGTI